MMRLLILCVFISSLLTQAQAAESVGRLFTTPTQRTLLNQLRQSKKEIVPQQIEEVAPLAEPQVVEFPDAVSLQGYVKRTDGKKGTIWVNHEAVQENSKTEDVTVGKIPTHGNRVPIKLNASKKYFSLKAGQSYEPETNRVRESRASVDGNETTGDLSGGIIGDD
jgi:hypothetical protein